MATKAERFRAQAERAAQGGSGVSDGGHLSAGIRAARRGRTKDRLPNPTSHNESARSNKKRKRTFAYELEPSASSRAPRMSTRASPEHLKNDSGLRMRAMNRNAAPEARAKRRTGNPK
jgi:hypothetical protein